MYELTVKTRFAAAHFLREYSGPCSRLHGHTWRVEVTIKGKQLDQSGMLIDFNIVKNNVKTIIDKLDHQNLNDLEPFKDSAEGNPTAENLARYIYLLLDPQIACPGRGVRLAGVRVWESPDACAAYLEEGQSY